MRHRRKAAIGAAVLATVLALSTGAADGQVSEAQSSDEAALEPVRQVADRGVERRIRKLLR